MDCILSLRMNNVESFEPNDWSQGDSKDVILVHCWNANSGRTLLL
jgi:hypothetical protein